MKNSENNANDDIDEYSEMIKSLSPNAMYDATKLLMNHAYSEDELLSHTVSGKRANTKVDQVKPKFTPSRFSKIKSAL